MSIEMPFNPEVGTMIIDPENLKDEIEEQIYKTFKKSREKLENRFKQVIDVDDMEKVDEAPGLGKIKISLGDEEYKETAEMEYDVDTKKVKTMRSEVNGNSWGETTHAVVTYEALPDGCEKLESRIKVTDDENGEVITDAEIIYTVDKNGILTYENKSRVMDF